MDKKFTVNWNEKFEQNGSWDIPVFESFKGRPDWKIGLNSKIYLVAPSYMVYMYM